MSINLAVFFLFSAIAVGCALMIIISRNPMHSILYLSFTILAIAGVFFTLRADFLAAIQIIVYAGGIVVLYLFVIIIINLNKLKDETHKPFPRIFIFAMPVLILAEIIYTIASRKTDFLKDLAAGAGVEDISMMLLSDYIIPFELSSVLLLAVLVGAIIVARKRISHGSD